MRNRFLITSLIALCLPLGLHSQSLVNSLHNMSASGPGTVRASSEQEICIFCHTPHNSKPDSPLWNRNDPGAFYNLYTSSTNQAATIQPTGSSLLCLSCHDGTIALGNVLSRTTDISFTGGITQMPTGSSNLSTDLSDDHPISFHYSSALATADGQLKDPALVTHPVSLENGYVQCTSCHDPHTNIYSDFLVTSNQYSELCFKCHDRNYWGASSHSTSTATWNGSGTNPWQHTSFTTVAENACESCHNPHEAEGKAHLMNYILEENNCLNCHNGNVASSNIAAELTKPYIHDVSGYNLLHTAAEDPLVSNMHVECEDCHNPHAVNDATASAPNVSGRLTGVKGVNMGGSMLDPAQYEYEVCFRCHSDSPGKPASLITRQIAQNNTRLEFNVGNPSYHPVAGAGQNPDVPSLISGYTESSVIYCTDCHSSNGAGAASGPHGSDYPALLKYQYVTADYTNESAANYALCYSCHSRSSILNDDSFGYHDKHLSEYDSPCSACHDAHGISSSQGNTTNNSNLINFDTDIVTANGAFLRFVDTGDHHGYCQLRCHGKGHGFGMNY